MKKSTILMLVSLVLAMVVGIGGTLAFLTDRDSDTNVFTVGNVDIELNEDFTQNSVLMPNVEINKDAWITNKGTNPAYTWMTVAVPAEVDGCIDLNWTADAVDKVSDPVDAQDAEGNEYKVYTVKWPYVINPGDETPVLLDSVTLASNVDMQGGKFVQVVEGQATEIDYDLTNVKVPVSAFAIQSEGFNSFEEAYEAYGNQWGDLVVEVVEPTFVNSVEELEAALANAQDGDVLYLAAGTYDEINLPEGLSNVTIEGTPGAVVGHLDLKDSRGVAIKNVTFDASLAEPVYGAGGADKGYVASISVGSDNGARSAKFVQISNCTFTGTPVDVSKYVPICAEDQGRATSRLETINISNNNFECDAFNYVRLNYAQTGEIYIVNNIFGGEDYKTGHNTMNFTGNAADLTIQNNRIYNWNVEKNAIGSSRQGSNMVNVSITGNTFSNAALQGEGGVVELKSSYTAANTTVDISGNTYAGELTYNDENAPIVKP